MKWCNDLCDYYGVSEKDAIILGTRATGRRPNLPASPTCNSVNGKTFEEIWDEKPRKTIQQKMDFYKDLGAWQVFRQCNYRKDYNYQQYDCFLQKNSCILEYGCGVAPYVNHLVERGRKDLQYTLVDVDGEHINFAKWRLLRKMPDINLTIHIVNEHTLLPEFKSLFDFVMITDVFEHVPNPYDIIVNIEKFCKKEATLVETWCKHNSPGYADLLEAELERDKVFNFINNKFIRIKNGSIRIYKKK